MAPTLDVAASEIKRGYDDNYDDNYDDHYDDYEDDYDHNYKDGIVITKCRYEGGKWPCIKIWWKYKGKCPKKFTIIIVDVKTGKWYEDGSYSTSDCYAQIKLGKFHLKRRCKYKLCFVDCDDHKKIYCESKSFWVN